MRKVAELAVVYTGNAAVAVLCCSTMRSCGGGAWFDDVKPQCCENTMV
ncbi:hypothetical protein [Paenibacillus sp. Soil766]|nr:hypothetical protein [Paenibacillus sp. Soil766]